MNSKNTINISNKEFALSILGQLRDKDYVAFDVEITNSHIKELNELIGRNLFTKSSLYISSTTLHELMKPVGGKGQHNYHELTPDDIYMSLASIKNPKYVFESKYGRYAIISIELSHFDCPLMMIVEKDAPLKTDNKAKINKIITIYPKTQIDEYIAKVDERKLLYKK